MRCSEAVPETYLASVNSASMKDLSLSADTSARIAELEKELRQARGDNEVKDYYIPFLL